MSLNVNIEKFNSRQIYLHKLHSVIIKHPIRDIIIKLSYKSPSPSRYITPNLYRSARGIKIKKTLIVCLNKFVSTSDILSSNGNKICNCNNE